MPVVPSGRQVSDGEVRRVSVEADAGRSDAGTLGVFESVNRFVTSWSNRPVTAEDLESVYVIGGGGNWKDHTGGTYRLSHCKVPEGYTPRPISVPVNLVAVQEPEHGRMVLIDGNSRARLFWFNVQTDASVPGQAALYVGFLEQHFAFAAACVSPLWRE